jgi:glycosyltransferase involved in cell wall biosynthesis
LRVLHVVPAVAARYGGPSAATFGMCRALESVGVETIVATTDADGPGRLSVPLARAHHYNGATVIFFPRRFTESYKWALGLGAWLRAHVAEFDVVHVHAVFSHSSLLAARACLNAGVPYIVRPLGTLDPWSVARKRRLKTILLRLGVRRMLLGAAAMHYTSEEEMRLAETVVADLPKGVVVALGIDDGLFDAATTRPRDQTPTVLALCRLDAKKGLDLLIRAFHDAAGRGPYGQWRLVIAGDGEPGYVSQLVDLARTGEASSRISFTGWVGPHEKTVLLQQAALFALPSQQENFGISIVEAMACGVPVLVAPGVNLAAEIASIGAGWLMERDQTAIAESLKMAMSNAAERETRGRAARQFAQQFRWVTVARSLEQLYRTAASATYTTLPGKLQSVREPAAR